VTSLTAAFGQALSLTLLGPALGRALLDLFDLELSGNTGIALPQNGKRTRAAYLAWIASWSNTRSGGQRFLTPLPVCC
jgi:hypothetical protein